MLGIEGRFKVEVFDPDGSLAHEETVKNTITKAGLQVIFCALAGQHGDPPDQLQSDPTGGYDMADFSASDYVIYIGVGYNAGDKTPAQWYDSYDVSADLVYSVAVNGSSDGGIWRTVCTLDADYTDASTIVFKAKFTSLGGSTIDQVYLLSDSLGDQCLAGQNITDISVAVAQEVQVTYTISLVQVAP